MQVIPIILSSCEFVGGQNCCHFSLHTKILPVRDKSVQLRQVRVPPPPLPVVTILLQSARDSYGLGSRIQADR
jgi:hypothetical protein